MARHIVCRPRAIGGLGVIPIVDTNKALIGKWWPKLTITRIACGSGWSEVKLDGKGKKKLPDASVLKHLWRKRSFKI